MRNSVISSWLVGARKLLLGALATGIFLVAFTQQISPAHAAPTPKVEVCHIPPGDPANFHTIRVSENALSKHLAHGDVAGPCDAVCAFLCDDGNACTIDDTGDCENNGCPSMPEAVDCNDSNACTADSCAPSTGCEYTALTGSTCTVDSPGTCEEGTGLCNSGGTCDPDRVSGCCLTTSECEAVDQNLCNGEECIGNECVTTSDVVCETDACNVSVCIPETGGCTPDEAIVCDDPECYVNGCDPVTGCFSNLIEGCCIGHAECDDENNCTTDTCLGVDGCVSVPCAAGDACNVLVDCDPVTCEPETVPETCEDDGNLCTAESCIDGLGCVSEQVDCPDGELCNDDTGACEPTEVPCFSMLNASPDSTVGECIVECETNAGCPEFTCDLKLSSGLGQACLDGDTNACLTIDAYGRDPAQGNCTNICDPPEPQAPDLLVCGGGCFRHNSETGDEIDAFTLPDGVTGCGDPGRSQVLFNADGTFWLPRILNSSITRICIYDETADNLLYNYTLPNDFYTNGAFLIRNWTSTHLGKVYANPGGIQNVAPFIAWRVVTNGAFPFAHNTPDCGGTRPAEIVAAPQDPSDPQREYGYAVINQNPLVTKLFEFEFASDPLCTQVAIVGDDDPLTDNMTNQVARHTLRLRIAPEGTPEAGAVYLLAAFGGDWFDTDEGIWRWRPGGALEQVIAMCDLMAQPCSSTPFEKPIVDFAIHPLNGNLYVLERDVPSVASNPNRRTLEVYDPQGTSLGVIHEGTAVRHHIEFFPPN